MQQSEKMPGNNYYTVGDMRAMLEGKRDGMPLLIRKNLRAGDKPFDAVKKTEVSSVKIWSEEANEVLPAECLVING